MASSDAHNRTRPDIAERLRTVREELGLAQKMMSTTLGLGMSTWQRIELGENVPSGETLLKIYDLGYNPGWILTGQGSMRLGEELPTDTHKIKIEPKLMALAAQAIGRLHTDAGLEIEPVEIGRLAAIVYEDIWNMSAAMIEDVAKNNPESYERYLDSLVSLVVIERSRELLQDNLAAARRSA